MHLSNAFFLHFIYAFLTHANLFDIEFGRFCCVIEKCQTTKLADTNKNWPIMSQLTHKAHVNRLCVVLTVSSPFDDFNSSKYNVSNVCSDIWLSQQFIAIAKQEIHSK